MRAGVNSKETSKLINTNDNFRRDQIRPSLSKWLPLTTRQQAGSVKRGVHCQHFVAWQDILRAADSHKASCVWVISHEDVIVEAGGFCSATVDSVISSPEQQCLCPQVRGM